jgi:hypothetical protein
MHIHAIGVPEGIILLEPTLNEEEQLPVQEQEVQASEGEAQEVVEVDCPDHTPCNFVKGKPRSIISLLIYEMQLSIMLYILLH